MAGEIKNKMDQIHLQRQEQVHLNLQKFRRWEVILPTSFCNNIFNCELSSSSSSIGTTAHCGLWPVEQCPSIFAYLPPTLSIFSLPALEDLFPSFPESFLSSRPFQFLSEDLFVHPTLLHSLRWPNQLILCPFIHFTIFSPLLISSSSRFVRLFHSPFSYLGPYLLHLTTQIGCATVWLQRRLRGL